MGFSIGVCVHRKIHSEIEMEKKKLCGEPYHGYRTAIKFTNKLHTEFL